MLNFEKSISSQKNIFTSLRWYKNEFYDILGQKRTDMNQKKPTIASTTSELSDGLRKNNSFMPKIHRKMCPNCMFDYSSFE